MKTVNNALNPLKTRGAYPSVRSTTVPRYADKANLHDNTGVRMDTALFVALIIAF